MGPTSGSAGALRGPTGSKGEAEPLANGPTPGTAEAAYAQAVQYLNEQYHVTVGAYEQIIADMKQEDDGSTRRIQELECYWYCAQQQVRHILGK